MCRYGFKTYKSHYLCFNCRKQFKQSTPFEKMGDGVSDHYLRLNGIAEGTYKLPKYHPKYKKDQVFTLTETEQEELEILKKRYMSDILCPQCRQPMAGVGKDVETPKMNDKAAWSALQSSFELGYTFYSCGCGGPGFVPTNKEQYKDFLTNKIAEYQGNIDERLKGEDTNYYADSDRIYWTKRVEEVKAALSKVK